MLDYNGDMFNALEQPHQLITLFDDYNHNNQEEFFASIFPVLTVDDCESNIDRNISSAFSAMDIRPDPCSINSDEAFADLLNVRGEVSKIFASIGSCNIDEKSNVIFDFNKPSIALWDSTIEPILKSTIDPAEVASIEAKLSSATAGIPKGLTKESLAKLWMIFLDPEVELVAQENQNGLIGYSPHYLLCNNSIGVADNLV